jgi:hypothetical protein
MQFGEEIVMDIIACGWLEAVSDEQYKAKPAG